MKRTVDLFLSGPEGGRALVRDFHPRPQSTVVFIDFCLQSSQSAWLIVSPIDWSITHILSICLNLSLSAPSLTAQCDCCLDNNERTKEETLQCKCMRALPSPPLPTPNPPHCTVQDQYCTKSMRNNLTYPLIITYSALWRTSYYNGSMGKGRETLMTVLQFLSLALSISSLSLERTALLGTDGMMQHIRAVICNPIKHLHHHPTPFTGQAGQTQPCAACPGTTCLAGLLLPVTFTETLGTGHPFMCHAPYCLSSWRRHGSTWKRREWRIQVLVWEKRLDLYIYRYRI